ncbi:hypothetical protein HanXRQr2_Chr06g0273121 [Helianthus annuus]|uniref:Uncharacterized protein n=1 Tax=Helianthus annuus TaxID=4232 RepID=A0A9K3NKG0_HELAN|nr:hypothetical protein HanXRQr2_Chr06g0273121 [Helianthus annuus]
MLKNSSVTGKLIILLSAFRSITKIHMVKILLFPSNMLCFTNYRLLLEPLCDVLTIYLTVF